MKLIEKTRTGNGIAGRIKFVVKFDHEPTRDDVVTAQTKLGYSPFGYAGPWHVVTEKTADGKYRTTWTCSASCD